MTTLAHSDIPPAVCDAYNIDGAAKITPVASGLINSTWIVESAERKFVLQRLHKVFRPEVNGKIDTIVAHMQSKGVVTTAIIRTRSNDLGCLVDEHCWRGLKFLPGSTELSLRNTSQARSVGQVLAEFHLSFQDFPDIAALPMSTVHDIGKHIKALEQALLDFAAHANFSAIQTTANLLLQRAQALPKLPTFPPTVIHGDPKTANFLFNDSGLAEHLIDLDTVSRGQRLHDLGDAFRSWCNPRGEDTEETIFDLDLFESALTGYVSRMGEHVDKLVLANLPTAIETIYLELAIRFCADALQESYFAWDPQSFLSSSEHQLTRARGQLRAFEDCRLKRDKIDTLIAALALE